jgi:hypothetical protein
MLVLALRPLWYVDHSNLGGGYSQLIEFLQKSKGQPIDGTRAYSEQSVRWLYWYVGIPAIAALCDHLPSNAAVATVASLSGNYLETVRSYCDVPGVGLDTADPVELARLAQAAGRDGKQMYVLAPKRTDLPGVAAEASAFSTVRAQHWNSTLTSPPCCKGYEERSLFVGTVSSDGRVALLPPGGPTLP